MSEFDRPEDKILSEPASHDGFAAEMEFQESLPAMSRRISAKDGTPKVHLEMGDTKSLYSGANAPQGALERADARFGTSTKGFLDFVNDRFDKIDGNHDSIIDEKEASALLLDPRTKGAEAVYAAALNNYLADISSAGSSSGRYEETSGLSRQAFDAFSKFASEDKNLKRSKENLELSKLANSFAELDLNKDSRLNRAELKQAIESGNSGKETELRLKTALTRFDEIAKNWDENKIRFEGDAAVPPESFENKTEEEQKGKLISRYDLQDAAQLKERVAAHLDRGISQSARRLVEALSQERVGGDFSQGNTDDCFLIAPMKELERLRPGSLGSMVKSGEDGSLSVKFPGASETIRTSVPTEAELASYANNGVAASIERAYAQLHVKNHPDCKQSDIPAERMNGGFANNTIEALTGSAVDTLYPHQTKLDDLVKAVKDGAAQNAVMVVGTLEGLNPDSGLQQRHAYGLSFNEKTGNFVLQNPYSTADARLLEPREKNGAAKDGKLDGRFELTPEQALETFATVYIERRKTKDK